MSDITEERNLLLAILSGCPRCAPRLALTAESLGEPPGTIPRQMPDVGDVARALADAEAEQERLRDIVKEVYFWLGPAPRAELEDVPRLVSAVVAERDQLHLVIDCVRLLIAALDRGSLSVELTDLREKLADLNRREETH